MNDAPDKLEPEISRIESYIVRLMTKKKYNENERDKFIAGFQTGCGIMRAIDTGTLDTYLGDKE